MDLVIETDIGHDPDDFFAITYLLAAGVNIKAVLITPGDPDQIAIARFICDQIGLDIPIGVSHTGREKLSSGSIHHALLKKYKYSLYAKHDGMGQDILSSLLNSDIELLIIGPACSTGKYLQNNTNTYIKRATMQGGFVPYSIYNPVITLDKFQNQPSVSTFNIGGDINGACAFLNSNIKRQMVGKNICHTVSFDRDRLNAFKTPCNRASELFIEAAEIYFSKRKRLSKKFHDPTAAVCHLHPEIGTWIDGRTVLDNRKWTTKVEPNSDKILVDINYDKLWEYLQSYK